MMKNLKVRVMILKDKIENIIVLKTKQSPLRKFSKLSKEDVQMSFWE